MLDTLLLGRLTLHSIPYDNPIIMGAGTFIAIVALAVLGSLTYFKSGNGCGQNG